MHRGFSLVEILTALAVLAILASLTAPGFTNFVLDARRTEAVNRLFHALFLARSESLKRGAVVSVCPSNDRATCARDWSAGWIVFANGDRDEPPVRDPEEPLIQAYNGWRTGRITSNRTAFSFRPYRQGVVNGTILFCDIRGGAHARAIIVSHSGRPRVAGRDASGKPLQCPAN